MLPDSMPSADQRALVQLLLARGKGYAEIATLLDTSQEEVRERARATLEQLCGQDPDREVSLTDYLLGQADPIGRADAVRQLQRDPELHDLADELIAELQLLVPGAALPDLPELRGSAPRPGRSRAAQPGVAAAGAGTAGGPLRAMPHRKVQLLIALLIATVLAVVTVTLAVSGGNDELGTAATDEGPGDAAPVPVEVPLEPSDDAPQGASGSATLLQEQGSVILNLEAEGLRPTAGEQVYVAWLYQDRRLALPLTLGNQVGDDGLLEGFAEILPQYLPLLPQIPYIDISLEPSSLEAEETPAYRGRSMLRGSLSDAVPDDFDAGLAPGDAVPGTDPDPPEPPVAE